MLRNSLNLLVRAPAMATTPKRTRSSAANYTISEAKPEEDERIKQFLLKNFIGDTPLVAAFGFDTGKSSGPRADLLVMRAGSTDYCIKAEDPQGQLLAVALIQSKYLPWQDLTTKNGNKSLQFVEYMQTQARIDELPKETAALRAIAVVPEHRNSGLGKEICDWIEPLARKNGFKSAWVMCVSEFTARLSRSFGWEERYRLPYKDYPHHQMRVIPPHHNAYIFATSDLYRGQSKL